MIYFVSFLGTLAVLPGNIVSALLMDKIGRLRMLGGQRDPLVGLGGPGGAFSPNQALDLLGPPPSHLHWWVIPLPSSFGDFPDPPSTCWSPPSLVTSWGLPGGSLPSLDPPPSPLPWWGKVHQPFGDFPDPPPTSIPGDLLGTSWWVTPPPSCPFLILLPPVGHLHLW
nr:U1 small nuclear ribonucleoprotein C-like [Zonotrichia albicollis]